ncbi:hypothetical protein E1A91_A07G076900v1 [Gossypium mustelinum]|uniref:Uncharacterized protein n=2 Tax=Gossypium TaxID=3633 RepID=A0A5D2YI76_GOSMU|nr:hypothetical protein E1A91_A07G076900v1 [Gossypium mustelinum]
MANSMVSLDKLKAFWHSQVHDEENWARNMAPLVLMDALFRTENFVEE